MDRNWLTFSIRQILRVISVCKFIAVQFQMFPTNQMINSYYASFQLVPKTLDAIRMITTLTYLLL